VRPAGSKRLDSTGLSDGHENNGDGDEETDKWKWEKPDEDDDLLLNTVNDEVGGVCSGCCT